MIRLLRTGLRPYRWLIVLVVILTLAQVIANLYLPTLNADIINNGVVTGDTAYILQVGAIMLAVTLASALAAIASVYFGSKVVHGARPRHARQRSSAASRGSRRPRSTASARHRSSRAPPTTCSRCRWCC